MEKCEKCGTEAGNLGAFIRHKSVCNINEDIIKSMINDYINNKLTTRKIKEKYNVTYLRLRNLFSSRGIKIRDLSTSLIESEYSGHKHSQETKDKMSKQRKEYLRLNPDKHPWKLNSKFKSHPCELLKSILDDMGIKYISEFPTEGRNFSIDIAIPEKKIAIEVNGNQHYNSDGSLKEYYQLRNEHLKISGWEVNELHYSIPYSPKIKDIITNILSKRLDIYDFNYEEYLKRKLCKPTKKECKCGVKILPLSNLCRKCNNKSTRMPEKLKLIEEISKLGYAGTGRKYKVSPTTVRRWKNK